MAVKSELYILTWDKESDRRDIIAVLRMTKDPVSEEEKYINGI